MADNKILRDRSYAACWAGGFIDEREPFVSLQIADAKVDAAGEAVAEPEGEIRELIFTDPEEFVAFITRGFEVAQKMFPADVDRIRRGIKRRMH